MGRMGLCDALPLAGLVPYLLVRPWLLVYAASRVRWLLSSRARNKQGSQGMRE